MTNQIILLKINGLIVFMVSGQCAVNRAVSQFGPYSVLVYKTTSKVDFALDKSPDVVLDVVKIFTGVPVKMRQVARKGPAGDQEDLILHKIF